MGECFSRQSTNGLKCNGVRGSCDDVICFHLQWYWAARNITASVRHTFASLKFIFGLWRLLRRSLRSNGSRKMRCAACLSENMIVINNRTIAIWQPVLEIRPKILYDSCLFDVFLPQMPSIRLHMCRQHWIAMCAKTVGDERRVICTACAANAKF